MAEVSKHPHGYNKTEHTELQSFVNDAANIHNTKESKESMSSIKISHNFVSKVVLWQTNPKKTDYTIYVKIVINPKNKEAQEVRFPFRPDKESLESVIEEMIDALQLNKHIHHKLIVDSISSAMKTKRMKIVSSSPIDQTKERKKKNSNAKSSQHSAANLSPKKHRKSGDKLDDIDDEFTFSPLSPLVVSPRTIHRKSNAYFPNLRAASQSLSESDPLCLIKQMKYKDEDNIGIEDDWYYNTHSTSNSQKNMLHQQDINEYYMDTLDKYIQEQNEIHDNNVM